MTTPDLKLVIFDVDGTLIDSQDHIVASMTMAFAASGFPAPARDKVLSIVGLSLPEAVARLLPDQPSGVQDAVVLAYKSSFGPIRAASTAPLFPGAMQALTQLQARDDLCLGVATGKSRRGLDHVIRAHGLEGWFLTRQTADDHPSKPHPSMVLQALADTGIAADRAVMIGDTTYDIEMGRAAGVATIGVSWGYHPTDALHAAGAHQVIDDFTELGPALDRLWRQA